MLFDKNDVLALAAGVKTYDILQGILVPDAQPPAGAEVVRQCDEFYPVYWAIANIIRPSRIAEIGVLYGYSLWAMAQGAIAGGIPAQQLLLSGIDAENYPGASSCLDWARECMLKARIPYNLVHAKSEAFLPAGFPWEHMHLGHVDGDHTETSCFNDLEMLRPCMTPGAIIIVDDIGHNFEVRRAADRFVEKHGLDHMLIPTMKGMMVIQV